MWPILVPYHQDERLGDDSIPLPTNSNPVLVTPDLPDGDVWERLTSLYDEVANVVSSRFSFYAMTTVVSGDCLVALGTIAGVHRAGVDASVVWFDAHGDVHTRQTSTSGYLGGMALRLVMGAHPELIAEPLGLPALAESRVVLVDARDLDPAEKQYLASSELRPCSVDDLDAGQLPDGAIILHIDLDVIDADELTGMRFPAPRGTVPGHSSRCGPSSAEHRPGGRSERLLRLEPHPDQAGGGQPSTRAGRDHRSPLNRRTPRRRARRPRLSRCGGGAGPAGPSFPRGARAREGQGAVAR